VRGVEKPQLLVFAPSIRSKESNTILPFFPTQGKDGLRVEVEVLE
jgi:hypothetical protein